jgi:hypothetical protein
MGESMWWSAVFSVAWSLSSVPLPVQGVITDASGAPATGTHEVTFTLVLDEPGGPRAVLSEALDVAFDGGRFSVFLGAAGTPLVPEDLASEHPLTLAISMPGAPPSTPVSVGWSGRAAWALDAGSLGGTPASGWVAEAETGNAANQVPRSNGTVNANLNADLLDGRTATEFLLASDVGNGSGQVPRSNGTLNAGLNADRVDGLDAAAFWLAADVGNATNQVPRSNGTVNTNLNADLVDGLHASAFLRGDAANTSATFTGTVSAGTVRAGPSGAEAAFTSANRAPGASDAWGRGSVFSDSSAGRLSVNTGSAASPSWSTILSGAQFLPIPHHGVFGDSDGGGGTLSIIQATTPVATSTFHVATQVYRMSDTVGSHRKVVSTIALPPGGWRLGAWVRKNGLVNTWSNAATPIVSSQIIRTNLMLRGLNGSTLVEVDCGLDTTTFTYCASPTVTLTQPTLAAVVIQGDPYNGRNGQLHDITGLHVARVE